MLNLKLIRDAGFAGKATPADAGSIISRGKNKGEIVLDKDESANANLIAYWKLDEAAGATRADSHTNGYNLTDTGAGVGQAAGKVGNASETAATTSEVLTRTKATAALLFPDDVDFALAGWVYFNSVTANTGLISTYDFTNGYVLWTPPGTSDLVWRVKATSVTFPTPSTATWYQFIAWHDATANEIGLRINNSTEYTAAHTTGISGSSGLLPFKMHQYGVGSFSPAARLDEVSAWAAKPDASLAATLYNSGTGSTYEDL